MLEQDPYGGDVFVLRGRRGDLIKLLWWDGDGLCLFRSGWRGDASSGCRPRAAQFHLRERSYGCYSKASIEDSRHARGSLKWRYRGL
jgi:hypothetical protein